MRGPAAFALSSSVLVLAAMVGGMVVIGSPWEARDRRLDEQRVRALRELSAVVGAFATERGRLPESLEDVRLRHPLIVLSIQDPVSGEPYEYRPQGPSDYELCARFAASSEPDASIQPFWEHPAGRHCFPLEVPPEPRHNP